MTLAGRLPTTVYSRRFRWALFGVVALAIFVGSVSPVAPGMAAFGPFGIVHRDKWVHATGYAVLAGTLAIALSAGRSRRSTGRLLVVAFVVAVAYGVGIEFVQGVLPARDESAVDAVADAVGALVGLAAWWVGTRLWSEPTRPERF